MDFFGGCTIHNRPGSPGADWKVAGCKHAPLAYLMVCKQMLEYQGLVIGPGLHTFPSVVK